MTFPDVLFHFGGIRDFGRIDIPTTLRLVENGLKTMRVAQEATLRCRVEIRHRKSAVWAKKTTARCKAMLRNPGERTVRGAFLK